MLYLGKDDKMTILAASHKLRAYRHAQQPKLTRKALAERLGVAETTLRGWEQDGKRPRPPAMRRLDASGIVSVTDWYRPATCPHCERLMDETNAAACPTLACPMQRLVVRVSVPWPTVSA
jgi:transposase-like protein